MNQEVSFSHSTSEKTQTRGSDDKLNYMEAETHPQTFQLDRGMHMKVPSLGMDTDTDALTGMTSNGHKHKQSERVPLQTLP